MKRLLITTGDPDGIGLEVTAKALVELGPQAPYQFVLWRAPDSAPKDLARLDQKFSRVSVSARQLAAIPFSKDLLEIVSEEPPARWVEEAVRLCLAKAALGMVTAPLSKTGIAAAGLKDRGHTEILSRLTKNKNLFMCFWGREFNVLLLTDHVPLSKVAGALNPARIKKGIAAALQLRSLTKSKKPVAIVGLNPHAGESGLLGKEEKKFAAVLREKNVVGPLVPDTAFLQANWPKYSVFVCCYHDQGLIPFKLIHGFDEGVHLTLGLPFVRTSVDHGTAKDIFGRDCAKHGSMRQAIELAMQLGRMK